MKTTIIDLLNKIANGEEPPKKIIYKDEPFEYDTEEKDYYFDNGLNRIIWLFDEYVITDILNDEVEILETTYKPTYEIINNKKYLVKYENGEILYEYIENYKPDKIKKLKATLSCIKDSETILGGEYYIIHSDFIIALEEELDKINEIIDRLNKE